MRTHLKVAVSEVLSTSGFLQAIERLITPDRRLVFTLHRVLCREEATQADNPHLVLRADVFEDFVRFLQKRFDIVPLRELLHSEDGKLGRRRCAITFDDGWEDNFRVALPILQNYGVPATIFLATGYIGSLLTFPEDRLRRKWNQAQSKGLGREIRDLLKVSGVSDSQSDLQHVHARFKKLTHARKLEILSEADRILPEGPPRRSFLTWDQVRTMAAAGVTFESHTVNHVLLAVEGNQEKIAEELVASKRRIAEEVGYDPILFAYPSGSFNKRAIQLVAQAGYSDAFTTEPGAVNSKSHRLRLPRVAIDDNFLIDGAYQFRKSRAQLHVLRHLWRGHGGTNKA